MVTYLICKPCDSPHFLQNWLMAIDIKPITVGESSVGLNGDEIFQSGFE